MLETDRLLRRGGESSVEDRVSVSDETSFLFSLVTGMAVEPTRGLGSVADSSEGIEIDQAWEVARAPGHNGNDCLLYQSMGTILPQWATTMESKGQ